MMKNLNSIFTLLWIHVMLLRATHLLFPARPGLDLANKAGSRSSKFLPFVLNNLMARSSRVLKKNILNQHIIQFNLVFISINIITII